MEFHALFQGEDYVSCLLRILDVLKALSVLLKYLDDLVDLCLVIEVVHHQDII